MDGTRLKERPSVAVRQSKRKLGFVEGSGGWVSRREGERFADNGSAGPVARSATFWSDDATGKAWLVANLVMGNPFEIAKKTNQHGMSHLFVNDRLPHYYLSILISKMQQGHRNNLSLTCKIRRRHPSTDNPQDLNKAARNSLTAN